MRKLPAAMRLSSLWMLPGSSLISFAKPRTWVLKSGYLAKTTMILRRTLDDTNKSNILPRFNFSNYSTTFVKITTTFITLDGSCRSLSSPSGRTTRPCYNNSMYYEVVPEGKVERLTYQYDDSLFEGQIIKVYTRVVSGTKWNSSISYTP